MELEDDLPQQEDVDTTSEPPSQAEMAKLESDPRTTKLAGAFIECRYETQNSFIDRKGKALDFLTSIFPTDGREGSKDIVVTDIEVAIRKPSSMTKSFIGTGRAGLGRERIVPGTLSYFSKLAREHVNGFRSQLNGINNLNRFGFRVQQVNMVEETDLKKARSNFSRNIIGLDQFLHKVKSHNTKTRGNNSFHVFHLNEIYTRGDRVLEYSARLAVGLDTGDIASSLFKLEFSSINREIYCMFTDIDIFIDDGSTFNDAIKICHRAEDRAVELHKMIWECLEIDQ